MPTDFEHSPRLGRVLCELLSHPLHSFVACWNWKAATLSIVLRAPVYVATTIRYGWEAASLAGLVEAVFAAIVAGVYAALTQAIRFSEPQTMVATLLLVILPGITLVVDAFVHYVMHTPNLVAGVTVSLVVSVLSSAFNWYSMRRGTLLIGRAARPFSSDILALPILILRFLSEPFLFLWRNLKSLCTAFL
jgi:hypothetical protein